MDVQRRQSIRLPHYDYSQAGAYFVTVCTHNRECSLDDHHMRTLVADAWMCAGQSVAPYDFVVMPNHIHGIVWIESGAGQCRGIANLAFAMPARRFSAGMHPGSLGVIVRTFKTVSARKINAYRETPAAPVWQRNYYERVLRDDRELDAARQYILDNPGKWAQDKHNPAVYNRV